ncbi:ABC transporter substrate-binding protein [Paralcaligenes ureilyticus]|uniref:Amino acid/amide ABC transporter substrate-binding protein (HAAT family) n=1 Tax=Paralcaligenes ureilyticus TaxID=627131 RepID=A0A4V6NZN9_9BURK|nr:ABC transporter substrate-binding protein [Paralcaligenes ureilyticus]TCT09578.1 amino acid/amide ABC transporter substrate-binding protein (HAAT family) [Paralcaligenes ureilyticus]
MILQKLATPLGWWRAGAMACMAIMLQASPAQAADAGDVVIGVFLPTTGGFSPLGIEMKNGYELAVKDAPKVKGRQVKLVVEDTQGTPATGLRVAQKMILQNHAKLLIGGTSSSVVLGINAQASRLNVPIVTTNSQAVQTTGKQCSKYLFRTNPNDAMVANANGLLMKKKPELLQKKWFVVFHDIAWGHSNKTEFSKIPGIHIVGEAGRAFGTADWASAFAQIQSSGANAVYLALAVGDDLPSFIRQARSFGLTQFMLAPLGMPDSMLQTLGENGAGMITGGLFGSWMLEDHSAEMKRFVNEYGAAYGIVPGAQAIQAYAGMRLTLAAMDKATSLDTPAIIAALENTSVDTVIGKLAIRKQDHQGMVGTYMSESVKLDAPKFGSKLGWKVIEALPWDSVKVGLADTGCKGL